MSTFSQFLRSPYSYPLVFPRLFGDGRDGDLTASDQSDVGVLGSFGAKQYGTLTIPAGVTWTIARGTSNGGLFLACRKLVLAGTIMGSGGNATDATSVTSGGGGDGAGGTAGAAGKTSSSSGGAAVNVDTFGRAGGGGSGAYQTNSGTQQLGGNVNTPNSIAPDQNSFALHGPTKLRQCNIKNLSYQSNTGVAPTNNATAPTTGMYGSKDDWFLPSSIFGAVGGRGGGANAATSQTGAGGGGGGGGGLVYIEAEEIVLSSGYTINLAGGNGSNGYSSNGSTGIGGGGCGGDGGQLVLFYRKLTGDFSGVNVNGGTGGSGAGTSAGTGGSGNAGTIRAIALAA